MEGEVGVDGAETSHKMVLEGLYCSLRFVSSVKADWCGLKVDVVVGHMLLQESGRFVVEVVELWFKPSGGE